MRLRLTQNKEIMITKEDIKMKRMIEEAIKNYNIELLKNFRDYLIEKTDLNDMIKEIINNIIIEFSVIIYKIIFKDKSNPSITSLIIYFL